MHPGMRVLMVSSVHHTRCNECVVGIYVHSHLDGEGDTSGDREGDGNVFVGRGDVDIPIIFEWRLPRSAPVMLTFKPLVAATFEAFDFLGVGAVGVSGGITRTTPSASCDA